MGRLAVTGESSESSLPPIATALPTEIRVPKRGAFAVVALFVVVHAILAFADLASVVSLPLRLEAFVAVSLAAVLVTAPAGLPITLRHSAGVLALSWATTVLAFAEISPDDHSPFAHWNLGAVTFVLITLTLRGRSGIAWIGYAGMAGVAVLWAWSNGLGVGVGIDLVIRHAGTLAAGTLLAVGLKRTTKSLVAVNEERTRRASSQAAAIAALTEREGQLDRVNAMARPILERIARSGDLDDDERVQCMQVEATLRDAMRGGSLFAQPVIDTARAARARGVDVTLLDDSGRYPMPALPPAVAAAIAGVLEGVASGSFTARLLPPGRDHAATVVVDSEEHRMFGVTGDGLLAEFSGIVAG